MKIIRADAILIVDSPLSLHFHEQMSFPIESAVTCGAFKPEEIPQSMKDYLARLKARPAYTRVEEMLKKQAEVKGL